MKHFTFSIPLSVVLLTACANDGVGPRTGPLQLEAAIGRSTIGWGDTTSIVFRLRNLGGDSIVLNFSNSCQILPYITTGRPDEVVYPRGGEWGCYLVVTSLTLAPGAEKAISVVVSGGAQASYPAIALLPGRYRAYSRLEHPDYPLRSDTLDFLVN